MNRYFYAPQSDFNSLFLSSSAELSRIICSARYHFDECVCALRVRLRLLSDSEEVESRVCLINCGQMDLMRFF